MCACVIPSNNKRSTFASTIPKGNNTKASISNDNHIQSHKKEKRKQSGNFGENGGEACACACFLVSVCVLSCCGAGSHSPLTPSKEPSSRHPRPFQCHNCTAMWQGSAMRWFAASLSAFLQSVYDLAPQLTAHSLLICLSLSSAALWPRGHAASQMAAR